MLDVNFGFQEAELPVTGANLGNIGFIGAVLAFVGIAMLAATVRRRDDETEVSH